MGKNVDDDDYDHDDHDHDDHDHYHNNKKKYILKIIRTVKISPGFYALMSVDLIIQQFWCQQQIKFAPSQCYSLCSKQPSLNVCVCA